MAVRSLALSLLFSMAAARLDKPAIENFPNIEPGLVQHLDYARYTAQTWGVGWIPADCKKMLLAEEGSLKPSEVEVYNVLYVDCSEPWIICRHKDSPLSASNIMESWGRLPVKMRSYIRHIMAVPGTESAYNDGENILLRGSPKTMTILGHEAGHSLDHYAFPTAPNKFSDSKTWTDAYNADSAVSDTYAQSSQQENLAQEVNIALFEVNVPGGVKSVTDQYTKIQNQYMAVVNGLGDKLKPGGKCSERLANSPPVTTATNPSRIMRALLGPMPDVSLSSNVQELARRERDEEYHIHYVDKDGNFISSGR